jgi:hypothetical protein
MDDGGEICKAEFIGGEEETQVGLGEGGDRATKISSHCEGFFRTSADGDKGVFVEVDSKASGGREFIKEVF